MFSPVKQPNYNFGQIKKQSVHKPRWTIYKRHFSVGGGWKKKKKCERENLVFYNPPMNINCVISSGLNGRQGVALEAFRHICGPHTLSVLLDAMWVRSSLEWLKSCTVGQKLRRTSSRPHSKKPSCRCRPFWKPLCTKLRTPRWDFSRLV